MDGNAHILRQAEEFLRLLADLTPAESLCFRSFAGDVEGLEQLCTYAAGVARGGDDAMASLTVRTGEACDFRIHDGTHGQATLLACTTPQTRLTVIALLVLALVLVILFCLRSR